MNQRTALVQRPLPSFRHEPRANADAAQPATARASVVTQLLRYLLAGGLAFAVDFSCLYGLTEWLGMHYLQSAAVAFLVGMAVNYALSIAWVFDQRTLGDARLEFALFAVVGVVGLGLNEIVIWGLSDGLGVAYLAAKLVSTSIVLGWNFSARKVLLFH